MKNQFTRKQLGLTAACTVALAILSGTAAAQVPAPLAHDHMILRDSAGQVVMSQFGDCWHSGFGPPPPSTQQCDPNWRAPVAQVAPTPAPAPAPYVAPAPVPAPYVAPAPVYEQVKLDANVLFDFDKSTLRPAGRDTLDDFISRIKQLSSGTITAVGFADRFGTDGYNQKLSERRVATVKTYLLSKGIDSKWIDSSGRGETQPTTRAGECTGAATTKTIACLQPDRHVRVEMTGSRLKK
jgi:OmpA-OmpF porin, OOP family